VGENALCWEIVFLGTGSSAHPRRGQSSLYISLRDELRVVIDFGCKGYNLLRRLGLTSRDIDLFIFTHTHYDHICGLPLMLFSESFSRRPILNVVADDITWDNIRSLSSIVLKTGIKYTPEVKRVLKPPFRHELSQNLVLEMFPVEHTIEAYGVILYDKGVKVLISGDTSPSLNVSKRVKGSTLAIHEATLSSSASLREEKLKGHTSVRDAIKIVSQAEKGALYHLSEESEKEAISLASVERGKIYVPEDFTKLKLC